MKGEGLLLILRGRDDPVAVLLDRESQLFQDLIGLRVRIGINLLLGNHFHCIVRADVDPDVPSFGGHLHSAAGLGGEGFFDCALNGGPGASWAEKGTEGRREKEMG